MSSVLEEMDLAGGGAKVENIWRQIERLSMLPTHAKQMWKNSKESLGRSLCKKENKAC